MIFLIKSLFALGSLCFILPIAYKKKSLSLSGILCSLIIGYIHSISSYTILISLLTFFVFGTLATNVSKNLKINLEDFKEGGQRNWNQVFSNSFGSLLASVMYISEVGIQLYDIPINYQNNPVGSACLIAAVSSLAAACGDTLASELRSVFSTGDPRLIIDLRKVPRGTNGGISIVGTLCSILGGFIVGISAFICNRFTCNYFDSHGAPPQWPLIIIATMSGFIGSLIDSVLGSLLQYSGFNIKTAKVVHSPGPNVRHISGYDFLSNHNVNLISSTLTGLGMAFSGFYFWPLILDIFSNNYFK